MDLRLTFNEDASTYDRFRPTYTDELFEDVIRFSSLNSSKRALEIGIGTGQATLPLPEGSRIAFLKEIADTIERCGGKFTLSDTMFLCMGRRSLK